MNTKTAEVDSRTVAEKIGRDTAATGRILERWLTAHIEGALDLTVFDFAMPQGAGMSNETLLFRARWTQDGQEVVRGLAARVAPSAVQLFKDANLRTQFDLLASLRRGDHVKVAEPLWFEDDVEPSGPAASTSMQRMKGWVPVSFPLYNVAGVLFDASPAKRRRLWNSAMEQLCRIAVTPPRAPRRCTSPGRARGRLRPAPVLLARLLPLGRLPPGAVDDGDRDLAAEQPAEEPGRRPLLGRCADRQHDVR